MYILEGNIGAGKSTFLKLVEKYCSDLSVVQEPQENWFKLIGGTSLFECFYRDPKRWAYTIETMVMANRVKDHLRVQLGANPNRIMERSVYSGHYCFAMNGFNSGYFTDLEWDAYSKLVDFLVKEQCRLPLGFIYLNATPETCFQRIQLRNRKGEEDISMEYLNKVHDLHEKFLITKSGIFEELKNVPVLVLDGNGDFLDDSKLFEQHLLKVREFVVQTQMLKFMPSVKADVTDLL